MEGVKRKRKRTEKRKEGEEEKAHERERRRGADKIKSVETRREQQRPEDNGHQGKGSVKSEKQGDMQSLGEKQD